MRVRLKKLWSAHDNLRTPTVDGEGALAPTVGQQYTLYGESLTDPDATRFVHTSTIIYVKELSANRTRFYTENSVYELENLPAAGGGDL